MNHLIRTQVIELKMNKGEEAFAIQQRVRDLFYQVILPVLEKAFDEISSRDEVVCLDRLEIDLGKVSIQDIASLDLTEALLEKIKGQITTIILSPNKRRESKRTFRMSLVEQWIHYMQYGCLPWNTIKTDAHWYQHVLESFASVSTSIELLRKLISTDARAVRRIVLLHSQQFLVHLTEALTSERQIDLDSAISIIQKILAEAGKQNESSRFKHTVWEEVLHFASAENRLPSDEIIKRIIPGKLDASEMILLKENKRHTSDLIGLILQNPHSQAKEIPQPPADTSSQNKSKLPDEGLFVPYAGLVLLHPFLFNLFNYFELLEGKDFKSTYHQLKALVVLHFLSTGNMIYEEHELVVAKTLCNYSLDELIDPEMKLTGQEQMECEELLKEVIARWSILKNTSPDTLRTNFLQRSGKLYTVGNEPHLLIESNVLDVLLDHLPWGIGIIKLPWMKQFLKVEWR